MQLKLLTNYIYKYLHIFILKKIIIVKVLYASSFGNVVQVYYFFFLISTVCSCWHIQSTIFKYKKINKGHFFFFASLPLWCLSSISKERELQGVLQINGYFPTGLENSFLICLRVMRWRHRNTLEKGHKILSSSITYRNKYPDEVPECGSSRIFSLAERWLLGYLKTREVFCHCTEGQGKCVSVSSPCLRLSVPWIAF